MVSLAAAPSAAYTTYPYTRSPGRENGPSGVRYRPRETGRAGGLCALLAERVPEVTAVEPDDLRAVLSARHPGVTALDGTAEALPLPDGGLDAVVVASAWHWFDVPRAIPEIARVLRPGGRLSVVWNGLDRTVPWVAEWQSRLRQGMAAAENDRARGLADRGSRLRGDLSGPDSPFGAVEEQVFTCTRRTTTGDAVALLGTYSRVIMLPAAERRQLLARAEAALRELLGLVGDAAVELPLRSLCWRATRSGGTRRSATRSGGTTAWSAAGPAPSRVTIEAGPVPAEGPCGTQVPAVRGGDRVAVVVGGQRDVHHVGEIKVE
jgi:SAM-dependent methyltransferase